VQGKKLQGISDVKDLTDMANGTRLVIELKNGFVPEAILEQLYKLTPMEESFGINNVCLVDGQPRTLGLKELLEVYLEHRYDVTRRRSEFRRKKAQDRLHIVDGLLIAILDIDEVIQVIRSSDDSAEARSRLIEIYDLSEIQANYILDMPLRRLTKYSKLELETEKGELEREIEALTAIIDDPKLLQKTVSDELAEIAKTYGTPRRTVLLESSGATKTAAVPLEVSDDPCWILMSSTGLLARTNGVEPFGGGEARAKHDAIVSAVKSTARGQYGLITSAGRLIRLESLDLPAVPTTAAAPNLQGGAPIVSRAVHVSGLPEGIIAAPLGEVQAKYPEIDIGSYPFYRPGGNGVAIVAKGTDVTAAEAAIAQVTAIITGFGKVPIPGEPEG